MPSTLSSSRLRWACRRGMLELDLILQAYVDTHYDTADPTQQQLFTEFLGCSDQDLFRWVIKNEPCDQPKFNALIQYLQTLSLQK